jgi:photosystem II stability/assembly factor-like uncharacterized protein
LPGVPPALEAAIMKALSKEPRDRQSDALSLLRSLEGSPEPKSPAPPKPGPRPFISKKLGAAILGAALGTTYFLYPRETPAPTSPASKKITLSFEWIHPKQTGENLTSIVQAPSKKSWLALGWSGTMLRSNDQRTWELLPQNTKEDIFAACSTRTQIVAVASNGMLLQSKDDGASWSQKKLDGKDLTELFCLSDNALFIGTSDGKIIESRDGGETWKSTSIAPSDMSINSVWVTATRAFASATRNGRGYIFCQEEGRWSQCTEQDEELYGLFGRDGVLYVSTPSRPLQQSTDLAKTWTPIDTLGVIYQFALSSEDVLYGAGQHGVLHEQSVGNFYYADHPGAYLRDLLPARDSTLIAVGGGGQIFSDQSDKRISTHFFTSGIEDIQATSEGLFAVTGRSTLWHSKDGAIWSSSSIENPMIELEDAPGLSSVFEARGQIYVSHYGGRVTRWLPEDDELFEIGEKGKFGSAGVSDGLYDAEGKTLYFAGYDGSLHFVPDDTREWSSIVLADDYLPLRTLRRVGSYLFVVGDKGSIYRISADRSDILKTGAPMIPSRYSLHSIASDQAGRIFVGGADSRYAIEPQLGAVFLSEDQGVSWRKVLTTDAIPDLQSINNKVVALDRTKLWVTSNGADWSLQPLPTKSMFTTMTTTPNGELILGGWFGVVAKVVLP